jgi:hypothetical protein
MKRILALTLSLLSLSCSDKGGQVIVDPPSIMRHYRGNVSLNSEEGFELRIGLDKDTSNRHAEMMYLSLYSGELKKGYIDGAVGYYQIENDAFTIFVSDTVYIKGRYLEDKQRIEVSWEGSLGRMWDTCAVRYNWPHKMTLDLFHEDY